VKILNVLILLLMFAGLLSGAEADTNEDWIVDWSCLISAEGFGGWLVDRPVLDSTSMDAALTLEAEYPGVTLTATGAFKGDSAGTAELRSAYAGVTWPGTPWIGIEGIYHTYTPFIMGLHGAVVEWDMLNIENLSGAGFSAGGILGFSGRCRLIQNDDSTSLTDVSIESPWLGFVGLEYRRLHLHWDSYSETPEYVLNLLVVDSDLRYLKPYVMIMGSDDAGDGDWGLLAEVRGIEVFETGWGDATVVPSMEFAGTDWTQNGGLLAPGQRTLRLDLLIEPQRTMTSFGLAGMYDLEDDSRTGASVRVSMVTEASIRYSADALYYSRERWSGDIGMQYRSMDAVAGCKLGLYPDSTRITATAGYTPRNDVSGWILVSADVADSPNPLCELNTAAVIGPVDGVFGIIWDGNLVRYRIEVRGLIDAL